jgi:hypothetical protein
MSYLSTSLVIVILLVGCMPAGREDFVGGTLDAEIIEAIAWYDGGSISLKVRNGGVPFWVCFDRSNDGVRANHLFVGARHSTDPSARLIAPESMEEKMIYELLANWAVRHQTGPPRTPEEEEWLPLVQVIVDQLRRPYLSRGRQ